MAMSKVEKAEMARLQNLVASLLVDKDLLVLEKASLVTELDSTKAELETIKTSLDKGRVWARAKNEECKTQASRITNGIAMVTALKARISELEWERKQRLAAPTPAPRVHPAWGKDRPPTPESEIDGIPASRVKDKPAKA